MNESDTADQQLSQTTIQQFQAINEEKDLENNCSLSDKIIDFVNISKNLLSDSNCGNQCSSIENEELKEHGRVYMEINDNLTILNDKMKDVIVEEQLKNVINEILFNDRFENIL
jgi:hypothetical protein